MTNMMLLPTLMTDRTVTATEREKVMIMPPWTWGQEETISSRLGVGTEEWETIGIIKTVILDVLLEARKIFG